MRPKEPKMRVHTRVPPPPCSELHDSQLPKGRNNPHVHHQKNGEARRGVRPRSGTLFGHKKERGTDELTYKTETDSQRHGQSLQQSQQET